jgi:hypothetical protein
MDSPILMRGPECGSDLVPGLIACPACFRIHGRDFRKGSPGGESSRKVIPRWVVYQGLEALPGSRGI